MDVSRGIEAGRREADAAVKAGTANSGAQIDFQRPDAWEELARHLLTRADPRPSPRCGRVECEPGWNWHFRMPDFDLWLAVGGAGALCVNGVEHEIRPGTLFCLRPGDTGWAVHDPENRLTVVFLHFDFYSPGTEEVVRAEDGLLPSRCVRFDDFSGIDRLLSRAVRAAQSRDPASAIEARSLLHLALLEIYRQDARMRGGAARAVDPRIEELALYLRSRPSVRMSVDEAASRVGLSADYFSRLFASQTGESFRAYSLRVRMERALFLLEETGMKVGEIAESLGYKDVYLFSRQFRSVYGLPPSHVRKRADRE